MFEKQRVVHRKDDGYVIQFSDLEQRFLKDKGGRSLNDLAHRRSLLFGGQRTSAVSNVVVAKQGLHPSIGEKVSPHRLFPSLILLELSESQLGSRPIYAKRNCRVD